MRTNNGDEFPSPRFKLLCPHAGDGAQLRQGRRALVAHVKQDRIGGEDIGRQAMFAGELFCGGRAKPRTADCRPS